MRLTSADEALLSLLRENARAPTAEIARRLQLSRTTVQSRIERLERLGVIAGYTVRVGDDFEREQVSALILITVYPKHMPTVEIGRAPCRESVWQYVSFKWVAESLTKKK